MNGCLTQHSIRFGSPAVEISQAPLFHVDERESRSSRAPRTSLLRQQAALWESRGFSEALLLRGEALAEAEVWTADHANDLTDVERDFLEESQDSRITAQRLGAQNRLVRGLALILAIIALVAIQWIYQSRQERQSLLLAKGETEAQLAEVETAQEAAAAKAIAEATARRSAETARRSVQDKWVLANQLLRRVEARALAAYAHGTAERDAQLAILLALEATRMAHPQQGNNVLTNVEPARPLFRALGHTGWEHLSQEELVDAAYRPAWRSSDWRMVGPAQNGGAILWDGATGAKLMALEGHTDEVLHAAWDSNGTRIATSSRDGTAIIWDARTGERLVSLVGHASWVHHSAWDSADTRIVTASGDGTAAVWDTTTGEKTLTLRGHGQPVTSASWSSDDTRIITTDTGGVSIAWDAATGTQLSIESEEMDIVEPASERTDDVHVATIQSEASGGVWIASIDDLVDLACSRVQRNLTQAEWARYVGPDIPHRATCP